VFTCRAIVSVLRELLAKACHMFKKRFAAAVVSRLKYTHGMLRACLEIRIFPNRLAELYKPPTVSMLWCFRRVELPRRRTAPPPHGQGTCIRVR
jgi:hypothetical protein